MDIPEASAPSRAANTVPPWVILGGDCLRGSADADADFSVHIVAPPKITWLRLHPRLLTAGEPPYVVRNATRAGGSLVLLESTGHPDGVPRHIVCDLVTSSARRLPEPPSLDLDTPRSYGILAQPQGAYAVVGVSLGADKSRTTMVVYNSETRAWEAKRVGVLLPVPANWPPKPWDWQTGSVIDDGKNLCWEDPAHGMLIINPTAKLPVLEFIPIPDSKAETRGLQPRPRLEKGGRGFIALSGGAYWYLEFSPDAGPEILPWKLSVQRTWELQGAIPQATDRTECMNCVCAGDGLKLATAAMIMNPYIPTLIYLLGSSHSATVDVSARLKTVQQHVRMSPSSSSRVIVCIVPDSLSYEIGAKNVNEMDVTGEVALGPQNEKFLLEEIDLLFGCWMTSDNTNLKCQLLSKLIKLAINNPEFHDICEPEDSEFHHEDWNQQNVMDFLAGDGNEEPGDQEPDEHGQENQEGDGMGNWQNNEGGGEDDNEEDNGGNEQDNIDEEDDDEEEEDDDFVMEELGDEDEADHGVVGLERVMINSLDELELYDRHVHSLDFGEELHVPDRIRLWRRGSRRGFEFYPTDTLRYIWRLSKLAQGLNPADFAEEEPPVPNPGDYEDW